MSIQLQPEEVTLRDKITERMDKARRAFADMRIGEDDRKTIQEAGKLSHQLHMLLMARGLEPKHHAYMIKNRDLQPDDPDFYMHFHPIEDLLRFLENEHANDDPEDQTIGSWFTFRVFSRRWDHDDTYAIHRTEDGWHIGGISISGPCDKGGRPFLFDNLKQDSISYPDGLAGWMEWLWIQAKSSGLTAQQVQDSLQQLADWVSETEKSSPNDGVWKGYK